MEIESKEFIVLFHCKDSYRELYSHIYKYKLIICYTISWSCDLSFTKIVYTTTSGSDSLTNTEFLFLLLSKISMTRFTSSPLWCPNWAALPCCCNRGFKYRFLFGAVGPPLNPNPIGPEFGIEEAEGEDEFKDCSIVALTAGLEKLASRITRLTLGSLRIDIISCLSLTFIARSSCCCCSGQPRL